jgi:hypothetical protein
MAEIKPVAQSATAETPAAQLWPIVGKAWINKDKKGRELISLVFGNRREPFGELVIKPNDRLVMRPNAKRAGVRDADYQICLAPTAAV